MSDFKQLLLETLQARGTPVSTRDLVRMVIERAGEGRRTASNVLTDIAALASWGLVERRGLAEEEALQLTTEGKQVSLSSELAK